MIDKPQQPLLEPQSENPQVVPNIDSPHPRKSKKKLWTILGIAGAITCLCSIICIVLAVTGVGKVIMENAPVESVLDTFMKNMEAKDIESAYNLFSPRAQQQVPIADLEKMIEGNNYVLFDGYQSLSVKKLELKAVVNSNPNLPQGTVANVTGTISYEGGFTGSFTAVLEKVDGTWRLYHIQVTVPPDKLQP
jgi:hypothetical protein